MRMDVKLDPSAGPLQNMFQTFCGGLDAAGLGFEPWYKAAARCNFEAISLMSRRAQAYLEIPARLSQCRSPQDLMTEQMRFWQTFAQHYTESSQRIWSAWSNAALQAGHHNGKSKPERDYITFPEPEDSTIEKRSRGESERRAA